MNKRLFVKENFRFVEEKVCDYGCKVRIFTRNNGIGEIPQELKDYIYSMYPNRCLGDIPWTKGNCDMGVFDAVLVLNSSEKVVDVYVCGILRRPFVEEERLEYERYFTEDIDYRLERAFDNHYKE